MKRTRKRILCLLAAAVLTCCSLPQDTPLLRPALTAYATETIKQDGITYEVFADHAEVESSEATIQKAVIPEKVGGQPVTIISFSAFKDRVNLTDVSLPDSMKMIKGGAFKNCSNLKQIDLKNIKLISDDAFQKSGLTEVVLPDSVTEIGSGVFSSCSKLRSVSIGSGLTEIGYTVFINDPQLINITVSDKNPKLLVEDGALLYTRAPQTYRLIAVPGNITEFEIKHGVKYIQGVFENHPNLKKVTISTDLDNTSSAFAGCEKLTEVRFRNKYLYNNISSSTFYHCTALKSVTWDVLEDTEKENYGHVSIGLSAFMGCSALEEIVLPAALLSVRYGAFGDCTKLKKITFLNPACSIDQNIFRPEVSSSPNKFTGTVIGYDGSTAEAFAENNGYAFESLGASFDPQTLGDDEYGTDVINNITYYVYSDHAEVAGCSDTLTELKPRTEVFGVRVTRICNSACDMNKTLTSVELPDSITEIGNHAFSYTQIKSFKFGSGLKTIESYAFYANTGLTELNLPDSLETICKSAFGKANLQKVSFGSGLKTIEEEAFANNASLTDIKFAEGVETIERLAFESCPALTEVSLPASLQQVTNAFCNCLKLTKLHAASDCKWLKDVNGILYSKDMTTLITIPPAWSDTPFDYSLPDSVMTIEENAAAYAANLSSVACSEASQLRKIRYEAFRYCTSLKSCRLPDTVISMEHACFAESGLETIQIPDGVTVLETETFSSCKNLKEAILPENIQTIEQNAFTACSSLEKLVILNPECEINQSIIDNPFSGKIYGWKGSTAQEYCEKYGYTFVDLETVDDLTYDGIIYQIADRQAAAIGHTDGITEANIRKKVLGIPVTKIADDAFIGCATLTSLTMPEGITSIGTMAFRECSALTGVIRIPDSVETIGLNAFQSCKLVKEFDFGVADGTSTNPNSHLKEIEFGAFEYCYTLEKALLPESVRKIGGSAFHMCSNLSFVNCGAYVEEIDSLAFADCSSLLYCGTGYSIRTVGEGAFRGCKKLDLVYLMDSAETLGKYALSGCTAMQDLYIYSRDIKITDAADTICSVTTPDVKFNGTIHGYSNSTAQAYAKKYGYKFEPLDEDTAEKVTRDGIFYKIYEDHAEVLGCEKTVKAVYIQPKVKGVPVTAVAEGAFAGNMEGAAAITAVVIPGSVKKIGTNAFACHSTFNTLTLSEGLETIGAFAFNETGLTDVIIPDSVKEIDEFAFIVCDKLRSFHIGAGTETIGKGALAGNKMLETITVSPANKYFKIKDDMLYSADEKRIVGAPWNVTSYDIPEGVENIDYIFALNDNLTEVSIPGTVTSMEKAFYKCRNLKTVTLGEGIRKIDNSAFLNCAFEKLVLPESLKEINYSGLSGCNNLIELTFQENVISIEPYALGGDEALVRLTFLNPACVIDKEVFTDSYSTTHEITEFKGVIVGYDDSTAEAFAKENNYPFVSLGKLYGYLYYKKYADHIEIIGHTDKLPEKAEIPAKIEELPVTVIRECAFWEAAVMKEIKLPETLTTIEVYAFTRCGLTALVIPDQTETIGIGAFAQCSNLATLTLGAKTVQAYSFSECTALKSVTLTQSVRTLIRPFNSCPALTALTIPDTVETVYVGAFDCAALETLTVGGQQLGGQYDSSDYAAFDKLPALKELTLTDTVKAIKGGLYGMPLVEELELPAAVASVDCRLFDSGCTAMMTDGKLIIRNPECVLDEKCLFDEADNKFGGTVYGYPESTAEIYCKANDIRFVPICMVSYDCAPAEGTMTGGEFFGEVTLPELSVTIPKGMNFVGWQTEKYAQVYKPGSTAQLTKDTVFHAYYEPVVCTVKFEANGGTGTMADLTPEGGNPFTLPLCGFTAPDGMQFAGWQIKDAVSQTYQPGAVLTVETDITLIPVWWDGKNILIGDVNMNGTVDTADAMLLTRYVNAWPEITVNLTAADINQDGEIDTQDAMLLTRYVNGWEGYDSYIVMAHV